MKNLPFDDDSGKLPANGTKKVILGLLILGAPISLFAQDTGGSSMSQETVVAILGMFVLIIAILVLMVAIYTLSLLKVTLQKDTVEETVEKKERKRNWFWDQFNKSVPQEKEATILLDHNYDGIRELDNHLPPWWTAFFYITIVFGVIYMLVYHVFSAAPLPGELYDISVAEANAAAVERLAEAGEEGGGIDESTVVFSDDPAILDSGKKIYDMQCASCHRDDGGGNIGPNLTDEYWMHGGSMSDIYRTIKYGVPQKGMISWEPLLSPEQMRDVSSYIMTMAGTNPPNAKAPQGEVYQGENETGEEKSTEAETET